MRPDELRLRQQLLLIRSTELRHMLHNDLQHLQRPAAWADQLKAGLTWLYRHPQWPAAALALLLIVKPRRVVAWTGRLWWLWKSAKKLRRMRDALMLRLPRT